MPSISSKSIKSNTASQEKPQVQSIDIAVIGDIVYDTILISDTPEKQSKTYPGGALFVKNFLESDPAINSKANVYGYIESNENNADSYNNLYNINIPKISNKIPLENESPVSSVPKKYRIKYSTTISDIIDNNNISFSFPRRNHEDISLSILVSTDLGIGANLKRGVDAVRDS